MWSEAQGARGEDLYSSYYSFLFGRSAGFNLWREKSIHRYIHRSTSGPSEWKFGVYPETTRPPVCICLDVQSDVTTYCIYTHQVCSQLYQCWPLRWQWVLQDSKGCPAQAQTTRGISQHGQAARHHTPWCLSSTSGMLALLGLPLFKHTADWVL